MTENNRFIIIGRSTCPFCVQAVDFCKAKGKQQVFLDYSEQEWILEDYKEFYNHKTVPIILANNLETGYTKKVGGYTDLLDFV
jgi:glutaredoxin